ncbi:hypothetical protein V2J52_02835 [Georgenia sp. MJ173]|uniref:hypothetical protein n=1 Tax=Georgenia sunbinii TaxID=3117728 RepID=UPI002F269AAF
MLAVAHLAAADLYVVRPLTVLPSSRASLSPLSVSWPARRGGSSSVSWPCSAFVLVVVAALGVAALVAAVVVVAVAVVVDPHGGDPHGGPPLTVPHSI